MLLAIRAKGLHALCGVLPEDQPAKEGGLSPWLVENVCLRCSV